MAGSATAQVGLRCGRMRTDARWWSLNALNIEVPDQHHFSTVDNLSSIFNASDSLRCFRKERVLVAEIQKWQLHDDPHDHEGIAKIESIRSALRAGASLPAVVLVHAASNPPFVLGSSDLWLGNYHLLEGLHRYSATCLEQARSIFAWVAHLACCGGPKADLLRTP